MESAIKKIYKDRNSRMEKEHSELLNVLNYIRYKCRDPFMNLIICVFIPPICSHLFFVLFIFEFIYLFHKISLHFVPNSSFSHLKLAFFIKIMQISYEVCHINFPSQKQNT